MSVDGLVRSRQLIHFVLFCFVLFIHYLRNLQFSFSLSRRTSNSEPESLSRLFHPLPTAVLRETSLCVLPRWLALNQRRFLIWNSITVLITPQMSCSRVSIFGVAFSFESFSKTKKSGKTRLSVRAWTTPCHFFISTVYNWAVRGWSPVSTENVCRRSARRKKKKSPAVGQGFKTDRSTQKPSIVWGAR